jgi:hypothetical protein
MDARSHSLDVAHRPLGLIDRHFWCLLSPVRPAAYNDLIKSNLGRRLESRSSPDTSSNRLTALAGAT